MESSEIRIYVPAGTTVTVLPMPDDGLCAEPECYRPGVTNIGRCKWHTCARGDCPTPDGSYQCQEHAERSAVHIKNHRDRQGRPPRRQRRRR